MQTDIQQRLNDVVIKQEKSVIGDDLYINLSITTPQAPAARPSVSIICVLDISGSMDTEATQGGAVESDGFSRLDLVKHSVNTIINSLSENDVLGIVTFSDAARVDMELKEMTKENREHASNITNNMRTQGSTNLWDGIRLGLQLTKHEKCKFRNTFVVVLSDGEPNQHPPKGQLEATREYIHNHPLSGSMSMFGYGYALDTELLAGLTELGGGCFGYIPDCSMIGTIFVNFLSSALSSFSPKFQASISTKDCQIKDFNGHANKKIANLGSIQYGVTRNCMIRFKGVPHHSQLGEVSFYFVQGSRKKIQVKLTNTIEGNKQNVEVQRMRTQHIETLQNLLTNSKVDLKACQKIAKKHLQNMKKVESSLQDEEKKKYLSSIIRDLESDNSQQGQVMIALSSQQFWRKWGIHYFPALKIAHANEMCTNFKDPGLQIYGGQLFKSLQSTMDTVFINLPPPTPSIKKYDANGNLKVVQDMGNYYDQYGGCIYGDCDIQMADGRVIKVRQLKKGDKVLGMNGPAVVKCVVKTEVNESIEIVKFSGGLVITKYHPVYLHNKWEFPIDVAPVINMHIDAYYNFVLDDGHSMMVNGIACITLAHGFQQDVAKHPYFGTNLIIQDLQRINGWQNGSVTVGNKAFKRDPLSKQVIGMVY